MKTGEFSLSTQIFLFSSYKCLHVVLRPPYYHLALYGRRVQHSPYDGRWKTVRNHFQTTTSTQALP